MWCGRDFMESFNVGDQVRISKTRRTFKKGYLASWMEEVFTIPKRILHRPPVYKIADYEGKELEGTFYEQELQKVNKIDDDYYTVEKIFKSCMRNKRKKYFVKFLGYPEKFSSWLPGRKYKRC